jgi:hypothetical protein
MFRRDTFIHVVLFEAKRKIGSGASVILAGGVATQDIDGMHALSGAPEGAILELFCRNLCQPCDRSSILLVWELKQRSDLPEERRTCLVIRLIGTWDNFRVPDNPSTIRVHYFN